MRILDSLTYDVVTTYWYHIAIDVKLKSFFGGYQLKSNFFESFHFNRTFFLRLKIIPNYSELCGCQILSFLHQETMK